MGLPILEMICGLPRTIQVQNMGTKEIDSVLDLNEYRQKVVRPRRSDLNVTGIIHDADYIVLDGSGRGVTDQQAQWINDHYGAFTLADIPLGHIDFANPTEGVVDKIIATGVSFEQLISGKVFYLPPGMGLGAAIQATAIYGLAEVWVPTIRLNRGEDSQFYVAEVLKPQNLRQWAVHLKAEWDAGNGPVSVPRELLERLIAGDVEAQAEATQLLK